MFTTVDLPDIINFNNLLLAPVHAELTPIDGSEESFAQTSSYKIKYNDGHCITLGETEVTVVNLLAIESYKEDDFYVFDISQDLCDCHAAFIHDPDTWFEIKDETCSFHSLMLVDRIWLKPEYRGKYLGRMVARLLVDTIGSGRLCVLKPAPIEKLDRQGVPEELKTIASPRQQKSICRRIGNAYKSVGFRYFKKTGWMYFPSTYILPTYADLAQKFGQQKISE